MDTIIYILLFAGSLLVFWAKYKNSKLPKGPKGLTFFGNIFQMGTHPHQTLEQWAKKYGDIYKIKFFGENIILLNSEELIREAAVVRGEDFSGRPRMERMEIFRKGGFSISFMSDCQRWHRVKKATMGSLKAYGDGLQKIEDLTLEAAKELLATIDAANGQPCDLLDPMQILLAKIVYTLVYSQPMPDYDAKLFIKQEQRSRELTTQGGAGTILEIMPWLRHIGVGHHIVKEMNEIHDATMIVHGHAVERAKTSPEYKENECILTSLLHYNEHAMGIEKLDDRDIFVALADIMFAGITTSSGALYSLLAFSVTHPDIGAKIRAEIDDVIGSRVPSLADRASMNYINATILETLRIIAHVPVSLPHCATRKLKIGGYEVQKGQQFWLNIWSLHHDPRYWENPDEFKPERFLNPDGSLVPPGHPNRKRMMAFGAGRRVCIGENVAKSRLFILICLLFQRYDFFPTDQPPISDPRKYKAGFVLRPQPYKLSFIKREMKL